MNKSIFYTMLAGISLLTVSCGNDDAQLVADEELVPIQICASFSGLQVDEENDVTRASKNMQDDYLTVGQRVNVYIEEIVPEGGSMAGNYGTDAVKFKVTGVGSTDDTWGLRPVSLSYPYYPTNKNHVKLFGLYPEEATRDMTTFTVKSDQSGDDNYRKSDLMYSNNVIDQAKTTESVPMTFKHQLSKIYLELTYGGGTEEEKARLDGTKVILYNVYLGVNIDASGDELIVGEPVTTSKGNITVTNNARYESQCILPPQQVRPGNFMKIRTGSGDILNFRLPQTMTFLPGYEYQFIINITQDNIRLESFSIEDWIADGDYVPTPATLEFEN